MRIATYCMAGEIEDRIPSPRRCLDLGIYITITALILSMGLMPFAHLVNQHATILILFLMPLFMALSVFLSKLVRILRLYRVIKLPITNENREFDHWVSVSSTLHAYPSLAGLLVVFPDFRDRVTRLGAAARDLDWSGERAIYRLTMLAVLLTGLLPTVGLVYFSSVTSLRDSTVHLVIRVTVIVCILSVIPICLYGDRLIRRRIHQRLDELEAAHSGGGLAEL